MDFVRIQEVCNVIRLDPEGRSRAAEAAAADLVIRDRPLDIEQSASPPQDLQELFPFLTRKAFHHGVSLVCNALLQKLFVLHKFFQEIKFGPRMERQEFQLLHQLNGTLPCTEKQIYKVAVEVIVDVHAADLRLYSQKQCATSAKGFEIELRVWREYLPDVRDQLFLAADPRNEWSSDPGHPRPRVR